jgi:hypothetical protein
MQEPQSVPESLIFDIDKMARPERFELPTPRFVVLFFLFPPGSWSFPPVPKCLNLLDPTATAMFRHSRNFPFGGSSVVP